MSSGLGPILYLPTGATGRFRATLSRADGAAINLTGATAIDFFVTSSPFKAEADHDLALALADGVAVVDALAGIVEITLSAARSAALRAYGELFYFTRATLASGEVVLPDLLRGSFWTDLTSALNQAANGDALVRLEPPTGEIAAITPDMGHYLLNRYDLTGLTGGAATDLDGLSEATLENLANGARLIVGLTGDIRAEYQLGAIGSDVEDAHGWVVICDNDTDRAWRLVTGSVSKQGQPCAWNATQSKWHQVFVTGAASAEVANLGPGFSLPL